MNWKKPRHKHEVDGESHQLAKHTENCRLTGGIHHVLPWKGCCVRFSPISTRYMAPPLS